MDEMTAVILLSLTLSGFIGYAIGKPKNRPGAGLLLGALLGPIGWILLAVGPTEKPALGAAMAPADEVKCAWCAELIKREARICKHCGKPTEAVPAQG